MLLRIMLVVPLGSRTYVNRAKDPQSRPLNLWRFYNDRAAVELIFKQLKGEYALGSIPTRHFFANETYFHLLLLAYNLVNWFKCLCLPSEFQNATLRPCVTRSY